MIQSILRLSALIICIVVQVQMSQVYAASVREMNLSEMSELADSVIVGRCTEIQPEWRGNKIFTRATIQIDQHIKGNGRGNVVITAIGGTAMHPRLNVPVTMSVGGGLTFKQDEEVVLFTKTNQQGLSQVIGMSQGKFEVKTDRKTGRKRVPLSQKKIDLMPPGTFSPRAKKGAHVIDRALKPRDLELNEFLQKIRENMSRKRK